MDSLPNIPAVFPPLPSSRSCSIAEEASWSLLLLRQFIHKRLDRLPVSPDQNLIPNNRQLNDLSDGESILLPFLCSSLNALASMTKQHDTVTTQLATVQSIVGTVTTHSALHSKPFPITASLCNLSQRVSAAPPWPAIPPTGGVTCPVAPPPASRPGAPPRKSAIIIQALTRTSPIRIVSGAFSTETPALTRTSSLTHGKPIHSMMANTLIPALLSQVILIPTVPNPSSHPLRVQWRSPPRRVISRRAPRLPHKWGLSATRYRSFRPPTRSPGHKEDSTLLALPPWNTTKPL